MPVTVRVRNYQSIRDATFEIEGFTALTGPNNSGKTALLRAIRAAVQNSGGSAFVRHGASKAVVDIDFGDATLHWEKGAKVKPGYKVNGGKLIHPGRAIPDEVRDLGVQPIMAGGREVWPQVAPQFTGQVFLLDQPGSVLAEAVADVDRVGKLNQALRLAESDRRSAGAELRVRRGDKTTIEEQLESFEGLDPVLVLVAEVEEKGQEVGRLQRGIEGLRGLSRRIEGARGTVEALSNLEQVDVPHTADLRALRSQRSDLNALKQLRLRWEAAREQEARLSGLTAPDTDATRVTRIFTVLNTMTNLRRRLVSAAEEVANLENRVEAKRQEARLAQENVQAILVELGQCPTCGGTTTQGEDPCTP